jgi:hypothetical protein
MYVPWRQYYAFGINNFIPRQRCSRLERFFKVEEKNVFKNAQGYLWR